jgi:hypothetical protein
MKSEIKINKNKEMLAVAQTPSDDIITGLKYI